MAKRKRDIQLKVRVTPEERAMIEAKMAQLGTTNMGAYLRKMAIDGYVVKLDLPELREMVSLLRYSSNNLNQLARRVLKQGAFTPRTWRIYSKIRSGFGRRQAVSFPGLPPSNKGVFIPCGAACCEVSRPCFFCGSASLQGKAASCMLKSETNKTGGILICVSF